MQEACAHARIGPSLRVVRAGSHRRAARARGGACDCAHGPIGLGGKPPHLVVVVLRLRANVRLDLFAVPAAVLTGRAPSVEQSAQCSCGHRIRACTHAPVRTCGLQRIRCSGQRAWLRYCSLRSMIMDRSNIMQTAEMAERTPRLHRCGYTVSAAGVPDALIVRTSTGTTKRRHAHREGPTATHTHAMRPKPTVPWQPPQA